MYTNKLDLMNMNENLSNIVDLDWNLKFDSVLGMFESSNFYDYLGRVSFSSK